MFDPNYKSGSEATLHQLIERSPDDPEPYQKLAEIYFRRGDLKAAWQWYMDALKIDPDDPFTCLYFGTFLDFCKDHESALTLFLRAERNSPNLSVVHWCLGSLYRKMGRFTDAQCSYERAVEVDPDNGEAQAKLAEWRVFLVSQAADDNSEKEP